MADGYQTKVYRTDGGDTLVIGAGGKLTIDAAATVEGSTVATATKTVAGVVKQSAVQADSTATDAAGIVTDFNALLAKLRTAGILATS